MSVARKETPQMKLSHIYAIMQQLRQKAKGSSFGEQAKLLKERIKKEQGDDAEALIDLILADIKAGKPAEVSLASLQLPEDLALKAYNFGSYFNPSVYKSLVAYLSLAHIYEHHGSPEHYALQLTVLFSTLEDAVDYLNKNSNTPIHEACNFALPDVEKCTFPLWQIFAKKYAKEVDFRKLLAQAPQIEQLIREDFLLAEKNNKKPDYQAIKAKKKEVKAIHAAWKKLHRKHKERIRQREHFNALSSQLLQAKKDLVDLVAGSPFDTNIDLLILNCYRDRFIQESSFAYRYMLLQGLSPKDYYDKFLKLDRSKAGGNIPDAAIDGADIGYPGYYLKKVHVQNEEEAARAACLGKLTHCCQSLSGEAGESCVRHGLTSPNGGFYIVCKGDVHNPLITDEVIGQSWVWRSQKNALVFDSIEKNHYSNSQLVSHFFQNLAHLLCHEQHTHKVNSGGSDSIASMMSPVKESELELFIDYRGYHDSQNQRCIVDTTRPYYFEERDAETEQLLESIMQDPRSLSTATSFYPMLNWLLITNNRTELQTLIFEKAKAYNREKEFLALQESMIYFIKTQNLDYKKIGLWLDSNSFPINMKNKEGETLLLRVAAHAPLGFIKKILEKGADIHATNAYRKRVLHQTCTNPEIFTYVLNFCKEEERFAALTARDKYNRTVLQLVAGNEDLLQTVLACCPSGQERQNAILAVDSSFGYGTALHWAAHAGNVASLKMLLSCFEKDIEKYRALKKENTYHTTVLHFAARNLACFETVLAFYPEEDRLAAFHAKETNARTVLHFAALDFDVLQKVLAYYPTQEEKLNAVKEKTNEQGNPTVLDSAIKNPKSVSLILGLYPKEERLFAIQKLLSIHDLDEYQESLHITLNLLPKKDRFSALSSKDSWHGQTLLSRSASKPNLFAIVLPCIPKDKILETLEITTGGYRSIISRIKPQFLQEIFERLSDEDKSIALKSSDILTILSTNPSVLQAIFVLIPKEERLALLQRQPFRDTLLLSIAKDTEAFQTVFTLLEESEQKAACTIKENSGRTLLHVVAAEPQSLKMVLAHYPREDLATTLVTPDQQGTTPLMYVKDPESLKAIFASVPEEDIFLLLKGQCSHSPYRKDTVFSFLAQNQEVCHQVFPAGSPFASFCIAQALIKKERPQQPNTFFNSVEEERYFKQLEESLNTARTGTEIFSALLDFLEIKQDKPSRAQETLLNQLMPDERTVPYAEKLHAFNEIHRACVLHGTGSRI